MSYKKEIIFQDRTITLEFQKYARQANGSVMVTSGGTQVLVTVCASPTVDPNLDFFPLGVDYLEKTYAAGRIPAGYNKREGKPSDNSTLIARVIDRPLRPCFPKNYRNDTVITALVVSYEHGYSTAPLCVLGASVALMISEIPFNGPVAALRLGKRKGEYIIDPYDGEEPSLDLDLNIACTQDAVLMVEAGAKFLPEQEILDAIEHAQKLLQPLLDIQKQIQKDIGKVKWEIPASRYDETLYDKIKNQFASRLSDALQNPVKAEMHKASDAVKKEIISEFSEIVGADKVKQLNIIFDELSSHVMRRLVIEKNVRLDGRSPTKIRPISCEIGNLIHCHGSALFTRGETQSLSAVTLAAAEDQQRSESLWDTDLKERFMLHYNFPPFSVGEARMQRSPGRREIGHGNLARKALVPIMPDESDFGYTIRLVSEILESNGSSSMATVCAGTMALLHAGVPLKASVAGIAMGLIKDGPDSVILSDILGDEDHLGDMDFKVCGNEQGITALQMDMKIAGIDMSLMKRALAQARDGRLHILGLMNEAITGPEKMSKHAPRMFKLKIAQDRIRDLIGPSGKIIKKITSEAGVRVDVDDQGVVSIVAPDIVSAQTAKAMVRAFTAPLKVGDIYLGRVIRLTEFGAFVELKPGVEGLCHISHLAEERVERVDVITQVGGELLVKIIDLDKQGRVKLSRKEALGQKPTYSKNMT